MAFDSQPHLVQKWSPRSADIHSGLAKLRPEESTALYDAVVYSLYNFLGVKGQKALVLAHRRQGHGLEVHVRSGARIRAARRRPDLRHRPRHPRRPRST